MCDPVSLLVASTVGTTFMSMRAQKKAEQERKAEAARAAAEAATQKTAADLELRDTRAGTYRAQATATRAAAGSVATPRGVFGARSFFARTA